MLPDRPPRSRLVHFGVDSAVAFCALFMLGLFFGVPWGIVAVVSLVIGAFATRFTREAEIRALAARRAARGDGDA
jgi:hypothetical protein